MCTDHVNTTPTLSTTVYIMSILFLPFSPWSSSYSYISCHIWKCAQTTWTPTLSTTVSKCLCFCSFFSSDFVTIFVLITIFGNAHRPYKLYSNIVNHSLNHVYSFFPFSSLIFWLYLHYSPYLKMCTDHVNSTPILSPMVCVMPVLFFVFFSLILWLYLQQLPY